MLSKFSVKKPYTVLVGVVLVVVLGIVSLTKMTTDLLPDMSFPYAIVITTYPGASPEEVEQQLTAPIEASMATTSNIKNISSMSYNSYSVVVLEYEQSTNMDSAMIEIRGDLDQLEGSFADSVGTPMIMQIDPDMIPVMVAAVDMDGMDANEISDYVESDLIPALESVEGVASVTASGEITEHIQLTLNQDKIDALNDKIQTAIEEQFTDAQKEIDSAKSEITSGKQQLEDGKDKLADSISDAKSELDTKQLELFQTEKDLTGQLAALKEQKTALETAISGLKSAKQKADELVTNMQPIRALLSGYTDEQLTAMGQKPEELRATLQQMQAGLDTINQTLAGNDSAEELQKQGIVLKTYEDIPAAVTALNQNLVALNTGIATIESGISQVQQGKVTVNDALEKLNRNEILQSIEISSNLAKLSSGESSLEDAQKTLDDSKESALDAADLTEVLSLDTVKNLLTAQNFAMPAGYLTEDKVQYLVKVGDKITDMDDLSQTVLIDMNLDGIDPIRVSDVADVEMADNSSEVYAKINGNAGVLLTLEKQTGYSTGNVTKTLHKRFDSLMKENDALHLSVLMDQGIYIDLIVDNVMDNMIYGAILAILILLVFLKDIRPTFVIACSIPLSVIFAVVMMYFSGITLNIISMSGLALGIGMLVDNSIVVIENIYRLRNEGEPIRKAAVEGAKQVTGAIIASTLTTVCVFAPIIFTEGITRQLFVDMALTIAYALLASLIVALTFVPMMASGVLRRTKEKKHPWFDKIRNGYAAFLRQALRFKAIVFVAVTGLLVLSVVLAFSRGTSFMPEMESTQMTVTVTPNEDVTFEELTAMSDDVIERISDISDIETIGAMVGGGGMMGSLGGSSEDSVSMYLILADKPTLTNQELSDEITKRTADMDCEVTADTSMMDMSMLTGTGISVQVRGTDLEKLKTIAADVADLVSQTEGTTEVSDGLEDVTPQIVISVDKQKAAKYGMTVAQVYQLVYAKMADSTSATMISTDLKDYEVHVDTSEQENLTRDDLKKLTFTHTTKDGKEEEIALSEIAAFSETEALNQINRESQSRYITVTAAIDQDHNIGLVSRELQKALDKYDCPEGYSVEMAGEDEQINDAMNQIMLMLLLAVIFIYLIMVAQFQSLLSPFIIMFTIPLAFTGGFFGLYLTGNEVSVIAMIGFVMLAGVIVNNGIVMVDYINQLRRGGEDKKEAIVEAGRTRLRPVLMTALTTILAMTTMALGIGSGSEMMQPMAIVTIGGLVYGTLLTLVVVPCCYDAFHRNKSMVEEEL